MSDQPTSGTSGQHDPWEPWQPQGAPQQPYGQQPYPQGQPPYGQPGPGQYPGQPPYTGQPFGPPANQPPYPGPGYGPQPPPRRQTHWVRNILSGIGAVVVASIAISALSSHGNGVSTTPSGTSASSGTSSATASPAAPAKIGSYFDVQDSSGDTYRVTLVKVIDPAQGATDFNTPDSGKRFVGAIFRIKALNGSPQYEDANNDAALIGNNGQTYAWDFNDIAGYTNFDDGSIHVAQGQTVTGSVVFQVPDGVKVTEVQWTAGSGSTVQWDVHS